MRIHGAKPTRQHALPTTLPELPFQHVKRPVRLRFVPRQRILVLGGVEVPVPHHLSHHGPQAADEEELPFVEVDVVLFARWFAAAGAFPARAQLVAFVVRAQQVVDDRAAFPGYDAAVGVLEGRHAPVLVDLQEAGAFDAVGRVTEFP